ncbi:uncharacterized protein LOC126894276 isoform X2 [Daktulosphaira vitifoliae]|uniref:uncharacterized protein LOC126894276 isoform X2 n=1 Tax=Daktulosphaira vitifoliae TaxID=58002 RepID=UPI0021AAD0E3|nr:uncharacterized protein LOC126894276 isoform X2 [Daktulosphaira vitifoliae]
MNYPVLLRLYLFFFTAYGIPADSQNEEPNEIPADNQKEKSYGIPADNQNVERDGENAVQTCSVCWDNNPDTSIGVCTHKFCKGCIDTWKFNKRSYRCPLCNFVYDNLDNQADVNIIYHDPIDEMFENIDYIITNSDYYNNNRTFQETINELVEELNINNRTSDNTGTSIITFEVSNDLNIFAEAMRNINRNSPYNAYNFTELIRIINAIQDNMDDYSPVLINTLAEAMRNINTTSDNTGTSIMPFEVSNDLNILAENIRIINRTPYNAHDLSEVIRIMNAIANNIDDYSPVLINTLAEAMRNINTTSENTGED